MANKLNYATPSNASPRRTVKERTIDAVVGSALIVSGIFYCLLVLFFTAGKAYYNGGVVDRPVNLIPIGIVRIAKGKEAAKNYRP